MKTYIVEIIEAETFIVKVEATDENSARTAAAVKFSEGDYKETGNIDVSFGEVFDETDPRLLEDSPAI